MNLLARCQEFLRDHNPLHAADPQPALDLEAFVLAEIGRAASEKLGDSNALVLFFATREGADEVLAAIQEAQPGLLARSWPS